MNSNLFRTLIVAAILCSAAAVFAPAVADAVGAVFVPDRGGDAAADAQAKWEMQAIWSAQAGFSRGSGIEFSQGIFE